MNKRTYKKICIIHDLICDLHENLLEELNDKIDDYDSISSINLQARYLLDNLAYRYAKEMNNNKKNTKK